MILSIGDLTRRWAFRRLARLAKGDDMAITAPARAGAHIDGAGLGEASGAHAVREDSGAAGADGHG
jgi:hypothetical protein